MKKTRNQWNVVDDVVLRVKKDEKKTEMRKWFWFLIRATGADIELFSCCVCVGVCVCSRELAILLRRARCVRMSWHSSNDWLLITSLSLSRLSAQYIHDSSSTTLQPRICFDAMINRLELISFLTLPVALLSTLYSSSNTDGTSSRITTTKNRDKKDPEQKTACAAIRETE